MSEEIKFRYILKHKGKIKTIYATLDEIERGKMDQYLMQKSARFRGEDKLLARDICLGLRDKDNKEIYRGDILNSLYRNDGCEGVYEVKWNDDRACFYGKRHGVHQQTGVFVTPSDWTRCEIIGNIIENPELLVTRKGE